MESASPAPQRYDAMTIFLHWLTALIVVALWVGGETVDWFPQGPLRADARSLHITLGLLLGALGGGRFMWRLSWGRPLPPVSAGFFGAAAKVTHRGLYALLGAMVCVGILLVWTGGDSVFNQFSIASPEPDARALADQLQHIHGAIGWATLGVVVLHSGAVLFHHYILHDGVLGRMLPRGRSDSSTPSL